MIDDTAARTTADAGIDLRQFHGIFFDEAVENLEAMEQLLLEGDIETAGEDALNAIFRCAHSVKGGAATFGFAVVAELTHEMESLLDKLRRRELAPNALMVDVLLRAGDALKAALARHRNGGGTPVETDALKAELRALAAATPNGTVAAEVAPSAAARRRDTAGRAAPGARRLDMSVGPLSDPGEADALLELFDEITELGHIEVLDGGRAVDGRRRFRVTTHSSDAELLDLFSFHVDRERVQLLPSASAASDVPAPATPTRSDGTARAMPRPDGSGGSGSSGDSTLRVSVGKVDQLINLVGELVITQSMLAQTSANLDGTVHEQLVAGLAELQRNTRELQESVMSIRMIPMSVVFNRFPRMLRELSAKLGKKLEFVTQGEATELDKGMIERITDPLTHLVRNSCDHGIEPPAQRLARGKPEAGRITLSASHQGGNIVIEVRDDGAGLNRARLLAKARERGLDAPDTLGDAEVWSLIFAPGFSTAEAVTDVSGRGVGMDVVKKNIAELGGSVEIDAVEGRGMSVKVRLPLTLAIMESMSVGVADECYILPLSSVVESFQPSAERLKTMGGGAQLVRVRDEYLPVIELEHVFQVPRCASRPCPKPVMVVVEADEMRVAMVVDELLGQQQVVVKNLETNYRRVEHVAGATIMGDGRVALILDVGSLVRRSRH